MIHITIECRESKPMDKTIEYYKDNLTSIWGAEELYIPNHSQTEFMSILEKNLRPVYDAAKQQGYGLSK